MSRIVKSLLFGLYALFCPDDRPKVVFYHDIGLEYTPMGTPRNVFWEHMKFLREKDIVCFDDGFRGVWTEREELKRHGICPKLSVAPRLVGTANYLSWNEIRELKEDYGFGIVCHGWSHQTLVGPMIVESPIEDRTEAWYERELVGSKNKITAEVGSEVTELCFPAGYFNQELLVRCKNAGYARVYASYPGEKGDGYIQPRCIAQDLNVMGFRALLKGGMNVFRNRYRHAHEVMG